MAIVEVTPLNINLDATTTTQRTFLKVLKCLVALHHVAT